MNNMLSNRLKSLTKYVNYKDSLIDIGCDHALLDIYLVLNNIIDRVIVSDVSSNALKQGIDNINKYNLGSRIETRLGNGLEVLNNKDNVDTVIISGMGTYTILDILNNNYLENIKKLIIQSNNDYELLRREIVKLGFKISNEEVIIDNNKLYINIVFVRGNEVYLDIEYKYGTKNMINKDIYYNYLINKYTKIISNIEELDKKYTLLKEIEILNKLSNK